MILYKRNAKGIPIFWEVKDIGANTIGLRYGLVGKEGHIESFNNGRKVEDEIKSLVKAKRKEGYKALTDLYDNAPEDLPSDALIRYLNANLPKFNTHEDGKFIPMLCKTLDDNKPFEKHEYFGQWKINGERCIITLEKDDDLFGDYHLKFRSRQGIDWTSKLSHLEDAILSKIPNDFKDMMIDEGAALDGELYLPGYGINEINSFIKNTDVPQNKLLQFWCYDIAVDNASAIARQIMLESKFSDDIIHIDKKETHLNNKSRFVVLPNEYVDDITAARYIRDKYIALGFEGLVIRDEAAEYQFGGRRNNSMLKYKKKLDGYFEIIDIVPEGIKRANLPKFILRNDINNETFECSLNAPHDKQEMILKNRKRYLAGNHMALVEFFERSGVSQVPFHARIVKLEYYNNIT